MSKDIAELVASYLTEDQRQWARLSSEVYWRRLQLLLLREILLELRALNQGRASPSP